MEQQKDQWINISHMDEGFKGTSDHVGARGIQKLLLVHPWIWDPAASSCIKVAINVLMSMRSNSPSCLMGTHDCSSLQLPDAAVDSVLSAAQEALYAVRRLLGCPCHANPQWQLLLAVICAEIITSYRRVINTYDRHRHTPSTVHLGRGDDTLSEQGQHPENTSLLKRTPILIGNYHIEGSIETILIGHVLRGAGT
ncbi:hypothetical protein LY78DRAFT_674701 [Colletotrichum sublineola]|nr:hypothetical protein LY78DRAFT_674701 [Colletotrichum sublineola]